MTRARLGPALAAASSCAALLLSAGPAQADTVTDARARAAAMAATVARLQTQAEVATEAYDAAENRLAAAVTAQSLAQQQLATDQSAAQTAADQADARIRALYESGGQATLLATVLAGSDPADAMSRLHVIGSLLSYDSADVATTDTTATRAGALAARLAVATRQVTRLQHAAAIAAGRVRVLLAAEHKQLVAADRHVRELVAEQQAAAAAADAAAFQNAVYAAGGNLQSDTTTPPNPIAAAAIAAARSRLGDTYVWGGSGPDIFDCSGLTQWSYEHAGIQLPRVAADQYNVGTHVALDALQPGDLLFWATDVTDPATIHHVAMYIGGGMMIAAPHTGTVVQIQPVYLSGYIGATRPYPVSVPTG